MLPDQNYLDPYRRHLTSCPHKAKGQSFTLCSCPVWVYGRLSGSPYRHSLQTNDWATAQRRIETLLTSDCPRLSDGNARSIRTAVTAYLADCKQRNLAEGSIVSYTRTLTQFADFAGPRSITELNIDLVAGFRDSRKVKPRTQRKEIEYMRAFCAFCVTRRWIPDNPAKSIKPPKTEDGATLPFTREEVDKLIAGCDLMRGFWESDTPGVRQRARALVLALLYSGLRVGDVAKLERSKLEKTGHLVLRTEKNNVPVKVLLHDDAISSLRGLPAPGGNPKYFFWSGNGDPEDCSKSLWRTISRLGVVADVHAHPHRFRDTFAVELITNGADLRTVQKLLGHSSIKTTERHYARFVPAHQKLLDDATASLNFRPQPKRPVLVARPQKRKQV